MIFISLRMVVILSIFRNVSSTINVTIGLLAPLTGARVFGDSVFHLVEDTFILIKNDPNFSEIKRHDVNFVYKFRDTACDIGQGLYELVSVMDFHAGKDHKIDTFIGKCFQFTSMIFEPPTLLYMFFYLWPSVLTFIHRDW